MGLVSQVIHAFSGHALVRLRKTFASLTVAEVQEQASHLPADPRATESVIASLIMSGAMNATLVHSPSHTSDTMVRLSGKPFSFQVSRESHMQVRFKEEGQLMAALVGSLEGTNRALGLSDEFVDSSSKGQAWTAASDVNQGLGDDFGLDMDEDIMGG
jgi:COP9 signalosome complex subunit 3